jgi:hypothetical protein
MTLALKPRRVTRLRLKYEVPPAVRALKPRADCPPPVTKLRLKPKAPVAVWHEVVLADGFPSYRSTRESDAVAVYQKWRQRGNKATLHKIPYFERDETGRRIP